MPERRRAGKRREIRNIMRRNGRYVYFVKGWVDHDGNTFSSHEAGVIVDMTTADRQTHTQTDRETTG